MIPKFTAFDSVIYDISRDNPKRRVAWVRQYAGQTCNYPQLGGQVGLDGKTAARYLDVFEQMYLLKRINVWARNRLGRVVKTPKLQFVDSGLLAALLNLSADEVQLNRTRFGNLLETFVYAELLKHSSTAQADCTLMYYRDADQFEVDIVIENPNGQIVGVEVKASATVTESDLRGLKKLASLAGRDFKMGVIFYDGAEILPLGEGLWAAPVSSLLGQP